MDFPFWGIGISRYARDVEKSRWFSASGIGSFKPVGDEAGWGEEEIAGELISFYAGLKKGPAPARYGRQQLWSCS